MSTILYRLLFICCFIYSAIATSSIQCPPNEIEVSCIDRCQRCEYINGGCFQIQQCEHGCDCLPGFYRNKQDICVPRFFCEAVNPNSGKCPPNEIQVPCIDRCQRCEYINRGCAQPASCEPGCNCLPGFFRNKKNICVPGAFCDAVHPSSGICPPNEIQVPCINRCQRCEYVNGGCVQAAVCEPGCNCLPGYFRNKKNVCVPRFFCETIDPSSGQCPANEIQVPCVDQCQRCEYINGGCFQAQICKPGCNCLPGFLRNRQNVCVPGPLCNGTCGPNEVYSDCVNPCNDCTTRGNCQFIVCNKGCDCRKGYRRYLGICIPESQCPPSEVVCGPNSKPSDCVFCPPTCRNPKPEACAQSCGKGCECDPGFLKDDNGNCIREYQCPGGCPVNEEHSDCVNPCNTCELKNVTCNFLVCNKGCDCKPGYTRNNRQECIPENFCPPITGPSSSGCPLYETPVQCINKCQRCEYRNRDCVRTLECTAGCDCLPGFLRNEKNFCVPAAMCDG